MRLDKPAPTDVTRKGVSDDTEHDQHKCIPESPYENQI